jgi:hypothetical protein
MANPFLHGVGVERAKTTKKREKTEKPASGLAYETSASTSFPPPRQEVKLGGVLY